MPGTLINKRQAGFCLTIIRIALSNTLICSRRLRHAASIGHTMDASSARSPSRLSTRRSNDTPRMAPGSRPKVLSMPLIVFDSRVVMPTS
jgi:hypothetical protein